MKILLKAEALNDYLDGANCFLLELDEARAKQFLAQRALFQMVQAKDEDVLSLAFVGFTGEFYDVDEDSLQERLGEQTPELEGPGYLVVPDDFTVSGFAFAALTPDDDVEEEEADSDGVRTEMEQTVITERGVFFRAALRYGAAYVESRLLPFDVIERETT